MGMQEPLRWWGAARPLAMAVLVWVGMTSNSHAAEATNQPASGQGASIWEAGVGEGFRRNALAINLSTGPGLGVIFGDERRHDWWMGTVDVEWILSDIVGKEKWYRGNWEIAFEVFGGQ